MRTNGPIAQIEARDGDRSSVQDVEAGCLVYDGADVSNVVAALAALRARLQVHSSVATVVCVRARVRGEGPPFGSQARADEERQKLEAERAYHKAQQESEQPCAQAVASVFVVNNNGDINPSPHAASQYN